MEEDAVVYWDGNTYIWKEEGRETPVIFRLTDGPSEGFEFNGTMYQPFKMCVGGRCLVEVLFPYENTHGIYKFRWDETLRKNVLEPDNNALADPKYASAISNTSITHNDKEVLTYNGVFQNDNAYRTSIPHIAPDKIISSNEELKRIFHKGYN